MLRVALTGGIASGKSYVARGLRAAGVPLVDADVLAREVVAPGTPALGAIEARFGPGVLDPDGSLARSRLAALVFGDESARLDLERIVHPAVRQGIEHFFAGLPDTTPFAVADIPLLFETGRQAEFAKVVVAACPPAVQIARVIARDGLSPAEAGRRLAAQWSIDEKARRADYVVDTTGSFDSTDRQIEDLVGALGADAARA